MVYNPGLMIYAINKLKLKSLKVLNFTNFNGLWKKKQVQVLCLNKNKNKNKKAQNGLI